MPDTAKISRFDFLFEDLYYLREAFDSLDERIFDGLAEVGSEVLELLGREVLVAEEDDAVLEESFADC